MAVMRRNRYRSSVAVRCCFALLFVFSCLLHWTVAAALETPTSRGGSGGGDVVVVVEEEQTYYLKRRILKPKQQDKDEKRKVGRNNNKTEKRTKEPKFENDKKEKTAKVKKSKSDDVVDAVVKTSVTLSPFEEGGTLQGEDARSFEAVTAQTIRDSIESSGGSEVTVEVSIDEQIPAGGSGGGTESRRSLQGNPNDSTLLIIIVVVISYTPTPGNQGQPPEQLVFVAFDGNEEYITSLQAEALVFALVNILEVQVEDLELQTLLSLETSAPVTSVPVEAPVTPAPVTSGPIPMTSVPDSIVPSTTLLPGSSAPSSIEPSSTLTPFSAAPSSSEPSTTFNPLSAAPSSSEPSMTFNPFSAAPNTLGPSMTFNPLSAAPNTFGPSTTLIPLSNAPSGTATPSSPSCSESSFIDTSQCTFESYVTCKTSDTNEPCSSASTCQVGNTVSIETFIKNTDSTDMTVQETCNGFGGCYGLGTFTPCYSTLVFGTYEITECLAAGVDSYEIYFAISGTVTTGGTCNYNDRLCVPFRISSSPISSSATEDDTC